MTSTQPQRRAAEVTLTKEVERDLEADIVSLSAGIKRWAGLGHTRRAALLRRTRGTVATQAEAWAKAAIAAKGTPAEFAGEEWFAGPYATIDGFDGMVQAIELLARGVSPMDGLKTGAAPGGRTTVQVLPAKLQDRIFLSGFSAEVWLKPGISPEAAFASAGLGARDLGVSGGVGVVLGAGNVTAIGPTDVLYELVAHNRASILKLNPTFARLKPVLDRALAPLIEADLVRVVNGGADVGGFLTKHASIGHIHITGSAQTHDAIVWGSGADGAARRASGKPKLNKPITSELGGVSPIIVIPGEWSEEDLRFQAEHVVTQRLQNSGHNCIAGQTLVLSSEWPQREAFLAHIRQVLNSVPARGSWYPGSEAKLASALAAYPAAEQLADQRLLIEVDESTSHELFSTEYFSSVLGHTALGGQGEEFFVNAVRFANEQLEGTLGASILVKPSDQKAMGQAFDQILAQLRYGTIAINAWSAMGFLLRGAPWGAFPGNTLDAVGSGIGSVHNAHLIAEPERTVVRGPFRPFPRSVKAGEFSFSPVPPWFVTNRGANTTAEEMTRFMAKPQLKRLPAIVASAFQG